MRKEAFRKTLIDVANPVLAVLIAFTLGGLFVLIAGEDPFSAYMAILKGAFGSAKGISNTVRYSIPMVLLAYSFAICEKCGYFNIGHEAQIYCSAIAIGVTSQLTKGLSSGWSMACMIAIGCASAALACVIPALVKYTLGASEIVVGVMMNYMMALLLQHLLKFSFIGDPSKSTLMSKTIRGHIPQAVLLVLTVIVVASYYFLLRRTVAGYRLRVAGANPAFAKASGLPATRIIFMAAVTGGLLSGLVCCGELFGNYEVIYADFAADFGFNGMAAALIGGSHPIGMVLGAILFGALRSGAGTLQVVTNVPAEIVECVQGFVMLFASVSIIRRYSKRRRREAAGKEAGA